MLAKLTHLTPVWALQKFENFLLEDYSRIRSFLGKVDPDVLEEISRKKALHLFKMAVDETPAYQSFLKKKRVNPKEIRKIQHFDDVVPVTDKENYVKKFDFLKRCREGHLPKHGNVDESGGTSGKATNWIHDFREESLLLKSVQFEFNYAFEGDKKDFLVLSAWSSGPWATGVKFCELMEQITLVKNTSTDTNDVINTLKMFGKKKSYLIGGYPPFVKNLIDDNGDKINWKDYNIDLVIGGEGVTIDWVHHMKKKLKPSAKIVSSYGASDIDIGVGFETPVAFTIREAISRDKDLQLALFKKESSPMFFQYNPTMHYIREIVNKEGQSEFHITLLDWNTAVPKIKYNLHDEGKRFSYKEMMKILKDHKPKLYKEINARKDLLHLPFLCVFGRTDGTLSFDGANVFPSQIGDAILDDKLLSKTINRFKIMKKYDQHHNTEFHIHLELKKGKKTSASLIKSSSNIILKHLIKVNPDYKESYSKNKKLSPMINLHPFDDYLFRGDDKKAKNIYFIK